MYRFVAWSSRFNQYSVLQVHIVDSIALLNVLSLAVLRGAKLLRVHSSCGVTEVANGSTQIPRVRETPMWKSDMLGEFVSCPVARQVFVRNVKERSWSV